MSTLAVNTITDANGGSNTLINGVVSAPGGMMFRNRIINGDMRIDQRNAGVAVTLSSGQLFSADRWGGFQDTDGAMTLEQSTTAPAGFVNSLKATTTAADGTLGATQYAYIFQRIEGTNVADLEWGTANAKTVTLSFWTRSSLTGTFGGSLVNGAQNRAYPFTYTISVADTWEYKTITIAGDTSGTWLTTTGFGLGLCFGLGVGSTYSGTAGAWASANFIFTATSATSVIGTLNATFYITGVQLEVGSVATPFERRPYGTELALCQRYYYAVRAININDPICNGYTVTNTGVPTILFPTTMRTRVTGVEVSNASHFSWDATAGYTPTGFAYSLGSTNSCRFFAFITGGTPGEGGMLRFNSTSGFIGFTGAEL